MHNIAAITQKMDKDRATVFDTEIDTDGSSANALHRALEAVPHMAKGLVSIINKFSLMPSRKPPPRERRNPHDESYVTPQRDESRNEMKPAEAREINSPK